MAELPTGTVTFLFTDIEGSTRLLQHLGDEWKRVVETHQQLIRTAVRAWDGCEIRTEGDSFFVVFRLATNAVAAAVAAQRALAAHSWPKGSTIRVRMGLHTGEPELGGGDYVGLDVHRAARISAAGHGGQILLSASTRALVQHNLPDGVSLQDLGTHRFKDLREPEILFQLNVVEIPSEFPPVRSLDVRPHNLPAPVTPLIGRDADLAALCGRFQDGTTRLVTLTGPGGTGKSRLGLQVGTELLEQFADGVFFVALASISDPELVPITMAQTLGVREGPGQSLVESLTEYLQEKELLLVLDNFEQILPAAPRVAELLSSCPRLKALVTSRAALQVRGEHEYPVPPLALPDPGRRIPLEALSQYAAVALFIQRALAVKPDFTVTNENAPAVAEICHRLDGLPLAIELAAARVRLFPPQALLARLDSRLKLLTGGARDLPARQQTLRGAIAWSYELLDEEQKTLFRRLSVFVGGCTLEAAEAVTNPSSDLRDSLTGLEALVGQSLLRQEETGGQFRFIMLETLREYAREQLVESGETEELQRLHAQFFLAWVEESEPHLRDAEQEAYLELLEREHGNLRAALDYCKEQSRREAGLRMAGALWWFWFMHGHLSEGRHWLERMLSENGGVSPAARAKALTSAGGLAWRQADYKQAAALLEAGRALYEGLGDEAGGAVALIFLGLVARDESDYERAIALYRQGRALAEQAGSRWGFAFSLLFLGQASAMHERDFGQAVTLLRESLALFREVGDTFLAALSLSFLGHFVALDQEDYGQAAALLEECLVLFRRLGEKVETAFALKVLGLVALRQAECGRAEAFHRESLALFRELGHKRGIAECLEGLAEVRAAEKELPCAARLWGAAEALRESIGSPLPAYQRARYERSVAAARAVMQPNEFGDAWAQGRMLSPAEAISDALNERGGAAEWRAS